METIIVLALGSIVFLSTVLIVAALMLRGRWDKLSNVPEAPKASHAPSDPSHPAHPSHPTRPSQSSDHRKQ